MELAKARKARKSEEVEPILLLVLVQVGRPMKNPPPLCLVSLVCNTNLLLDIDIPVSHGEIVWLFIYK